MPEKHRIGQHEIELAAPASFSIRREIALAYAANHERAFFAALAACWKGPGRPKVQYAACDYSPLKFGGAVMDELHAAGVDLDSALMVAVKAWNLISDSVWTPDPEAAAVPSEPAGEGSAPPAAE